MNIFQALSNLNYGGTTYANGSFFVGKLEHFAEHIKLGIVKLIEGAQTIEEAATIAASEPAAPAPKQDDGGTYGPFPPKQEVQAQAPADTSPQTPAADANTSAQTETAPQAPAKPEVGTGDTLPDGNDL